MLADATSQLMAEYDITITSRQKAWYHFYGALSMVYGTRIAIFALKKKTVDKAARESAPDLQPIHKANGAAYAQPHV